MLKQLVKDYLIREPHFRERHAKDRGIANLLIEKYNLDISKEKLTEIIQDANSMDRYWRMIMNENPELRGNDYDTKDIVESRKEMELGYETGYLGDVKKLREI